MDPAESRTRAGWGFALLALVFCLGLSLWAFGPGLRGQFLNYDDNLTVVDNPVFRLPPLQAVTRIVNPVAAPIADVYYPVTYLSLYFDHLVFGGPFGFHLHSLLLHGLVAFVLVLLLLDLGVPTWGALLGAVPLLIHPAMAESVVWITSRKDLLAGLFVLLGLLFGRRALRSGRGLGWVVAFVVLACYSKGTAIVFPLLALVLWSPPFLRERLRLRRKALEFTAAACLVAGAHQFWLAQLAGTSVFPGDVAALPGTFVHYLRVLVWPVDLAVHYPRSETLAAFAAGLPAKLTYLIAYMLGALVLFRQRTVGLRYAGAGMLLFLAALLPFNNVFPATALPAADRYLYLALPWAGLALAGLVWALPRRAGLGVAVSLLVVSPALLLPRARTRAEAFQRSDKLWLANLAVWPNDVVAKTNLAQWHMMRGEFENAEKLLRDAAFVAANPVLKLRVATMLYTCTHMLGDVQDATIQIEAATRLADALAGGGKLGEGPLEHRRRRIEFRLQWAETLEDAGRLPEAEALLDEVLEVSPNEPDALGMKASHLLDAVLAKHPKLPLPADHPALVAAKAMLARAIPVEGRPASVRLALARVDYHRLLGQSSKAMAVLTSIKKQRPGNERIFLAGARIYLDQNLVDGAIEELATGLRYRPSSVRLNQTLGAIYAGEGRLPAAEACLRTALRRNPSSPALRRSLARVLAGRVRQLVSLEKAEVYAPLVDEAASLDPELPVLPFLRALVKRAHRDFAGALALAREAERALPDDQEIARFALDMLKQLGWWELLQNKNSDVAYRRFRELLDIAPPDYDVAAVREAMHGEFRSRMKAASAAASVGDWDKAESAWRSARELFPNQDRVLLQLGVVTYLRKAFDESEKLLRESIELTEKRHADPGRAVYYLAKLLIDRGQKDDAVALCKLYLEGEKKDRIVELDMKARLVALQQLLAQH